MRRVVRARWAAGGGEEARLRDVWADAGRAGLSVREVSGVLRRMEEAGDLMEQDGALHRLDDDM